MPIKLFGNEFGVSDSEAKLLSQVGGVFKGAFARLHNFIKFRCPSCRSRKICFKGYIGDEPLELYTCFSCTKKSIMLSSGLMEVDVK